MYATMPRSIWLAAALALLLQTTARAQTAPGLGYVYPPGAAAGTTVEVRLGGYDWTPDTQFFVHDPRVKLEILGPPGEVLMPESPYWFGQKSFATAFPLPREVPARLTIPADMPPGAIEWQAANANGSTGVGSFLVGTGPEVIEDFACAKPQRLAKIPVTISGRLGRIEEVDRYRFSTPQDGPVTCELRSRLGRPFNGVLEIRDTGGQLLADVADTQGVDAVVTFTANAGDEYTVSVHDVDFRGNLAFVYRLSIRQGPRLLAAIPAAGQRGETRQVEFVGIGIASGQSKVESLVEEVTFPMEPSVDFFSYQLHTPFGTSQPFPLLISDVPESVEPAEQSGEAHRLDAPGAVTGVLDRRGDRDRYRLEVKKGETWKISLEVQRLGSPLDPVLTILGPDGAEVAKNDDLAGTVDAGVDFTAPSDGGYELVVSDVSGTSGTRVATYRLMAQRRDCLPAGFTLEAPRNINLPLGGKAEVTVKVQRRGGWNEPLSLQITGLPVGVSAPDDLVIAADQGELKIPLESAEDATSVAAPVTIVATGRVDGEHVTQILPPVLLATTMKARARVTPVDKDGGRTVHAGTTYPAEVIVERLEGYEGKVLLEMASQQSRHRQGITGPELTVAPGVTRMHYPVFMPEWLETNRTSRMILNAVVKVPDPQGNERYLLNRMDGRITMSVEGPLLKISHATDELSPLPGESIEIPLTISRSAKLPEPARIELRLPAALRGRFTAEPIEVPPDQSETVLLILPTSNSPLNGEHELTIRATALQQNRFPVISETQVLVIFPATAEQ